MQEQLSAAPRATAMDTGEVARGRRPWAKPDRVRSDFLRRGLLQGFYQDLCVGFRPQLRGR
jgi:hypothetical protein